MAVKYKILFRACDKIESVHNAERPFNLSKQQIIKLSFYSIYKSISGYDFNITIIGDELSKHMLNFFEDFKGVNVLNDKLGSAAKSLQKQINIALETPDNEWVYLCEDDYVHSENAFELITEFITNKKQYLKTSGKKKNFVNRFIGDLSNIPLIIHPPDYPDRYEPQWKRFSFVFLSKYCHWRQITNTTHSILLMSNTVRQFEKYINESAILPSDSQLSEKVYGRLWFKNKALCVSPIPGLSTHMTKGVMTPFADWESVCEKYINEMNTKGIWQ